MSKICHICDKLLDSTFFLNIYLAIPKDCVSYPEQDLFGYGIWLGT